MGHRVWSLLLKGFNGNKATLTFKMIMMLAIYIVKTNPHIKRALHITYSYVFLDEFQDTTDIQYDLVKECFFGSNTKITAVGDNKQRIMVWAGAVKRIFNIFCDEWNPKGSFANESSLCTKIGCTTTRNVCFSKRKGNRSLCFR